MEIITEQSDAEYISAAPDMKDIKYCWLELINFLNIFMSYVDSTRNIYLFAFARYVL